MLIEIIIIIRKKGGRTGVAGAVAVPNEGLEGAVDLEGLAQGNTTCDTHTQQESAHDTTRCTRD